MSRAQGPVCFFDPQQFPWTQQFLDHYDDIRSEVERQLRLMTPVYPSYTASVSGEPLTQGAWFTSTLLFFTIRNPSIMSEMPVTARLLERIPGLVTAMLARMDADTHLKAHKGYSPHTLRCHFGVVVPEPDCCVLRVQNEKRSWRERDWLIFDDYLEHEVWHRGKESRTVLLIDVVRPGATIKPQQIGRNFFNRALGTRFDDELAKVAAPKQWLEWLEAGEFRLPAVPSTASKARRPQR